ncbi:MAG: ECF-type sigma factor [Thermoanaerobaculia bacterium]|nr:ECF-type sigma factor [Thermoanaerobaculia bacterium]
MTDEAIPSESVDVTELLHAWSAGEPGALERLIPVVEGALRRRARRAMAGERPDHTLEPTALVNEVFLRLAGHEEVSWINRSQFFGFSAQLMRRILVDHARRRRRDKRGGGFKLVALEQVQEPHGAGTDLDLLALDEALTALAALSPRQSRIVELRYFAGLTIDETAEVLEISASLVSKEWTLSRAWLYDRLRPPEEPR